MRCDWTSPQGKRMLSEVLASKQIKEDPESLQIWGKDWTNGFVVAPSAIVFPESIDQIQDLFFMRGHHLKLVPSGGQPGCRRRGSESGRGGRIFDRMNKILDFSADRIVSCQPGSHRESATFAEEQGLFYPVTLRPGFFANWWQRSDKCRRH